MRRLLVLLLFFLPAVPAFAQATDTPTPTSTPTSTPTFTPVPDLAIYMTVVPPGAAIEDAQPGSVVFVVSAGEILITIPIVGLLLTRLFNLVLRARGHDA